MTERATTVVVARRVRPGLEQASERWIARLRRAAATAPGFLGSDAHPPGDAHPDEWLVVYSFASTADLDGWLASPGRQRLLAESGELFEDDIREQRIADRPATDTVTLVSSVRLRPGAEAEHRVLHDQGVRAAADLGGLVRAELLPAVTDVQPDTVAVLTFASRTDLERWLASDERVDTLQRMQLLLVGDRTVNVVGGFAGWFGSGPAAPRRWKQALTVVAGLIPVSLAVTLVRTAVWAHPPLVVSIAIAAAANVAVLTWIVMPFLTNRLEPWLAR